MGTSKRSMKQDEFRIPAAEMLNDKDWVELNRLKRIHASEGSSAFKKAVRKLRENDPPSYLRIIAALIPMKLHNMLKDWMAENGITEET